MPATALRAPSIRSAPMPVVTSKPLASTWRSTGPGVVKRGKIRLAPFTKSNLRATDIGLSIAVPQTSPSPCAAWVSPTENRDRKNVVEGKSESVRVDPGWQRLKKKRKKEN